MVFYRKYRPQNIDELDSKAIRDTLHSVLLPFTKKGKSDSAPHAFLFTGPKGLGKTSTARIIAKVVNCTNRKEGSLEPCNKCEQCTSITNGTNIDVLEIDGASNRGIDEIRDLREKIKLSPAYSNKKIYIIDEVHMLTTEAFNALLKTLEEPPSHALFILCTTEPHKVPETISSRCFCISFKLATTEELVRSFARITASEKVKIDKDALETIAYLADGSFRDGTKILDEMVAVAKGEKITKELIEKNYQITNISQQVDQIIQILADRNLKTGLSLVEDLVKQGIDEKYFLDQMIVRLHQILLQKAGVEESNLPSNFSLTEISLLGGLMQKASFEIKGSVLPQLPLELLVVSWCSKDLVQDNSDEPDQQKEEKKETIKNVKKSEELNSSSDGENVWQKLIAKVKTKDHSIAGVLRGVSLKNWDSKQVIIETGFKFHKEKLEDPKTILILSNAVQEISGEKLEIRILFKDK
ncbi:DNA polymerase III subunit gamma/tau [Patescibacteria group bacterium]|nr:DNA polymerase III subunit gamma/tau [Patescibacteria group bacterium]